MKKKELLIISVTVFLTILTWIVADIFHILSTEKVKVLNPTLGQSIQIKIDESIFGKLQNKK